MREPLHPGDVPSGRLGDLFDRCPRADAGLNFLGTEHACDLDVDFTLAAADRFTLRGRTQPVVCAQQEPLAQLVALADDVFGVDVEATHRKFPHADLLRAVAPSPSAANFRPAQRESSADTLADALRASRPMLFAQ